MPIFFMLFMMSSCGSKNDLEIDQEVKPVTNLAAEKTDKANELKVTWNNSTNIEFVEISYQKEGEEEIHTVTPNVRVYGSNGSFLAKLTTHDTYTIMAVAIGKSGERSEKVTVTATPANEDAPISYEIIDDKLPIADPYILYHDGKYYAYGTRINGFEVYISEDLKHWKKNTQLALSPANSWGTRWYWAPEVYYVESKNRFYMFYTVDEHICVASANSPTGPFIQSVKKPIVENEKAIDASLFIDDNGTPYLYYVRFTGGNVIWVAEMNDDLQSIKTNTLSRCIGVEEPWEKIQANVAEGPSVLKIKGTYYLTYSANHYQSQDYAVGYATSSSPKGPWKKYVGNPILRRDMPAASGEVGVGHGAPFITADGSYKYIYHAHANNNSVGPRKSYISDYNISDDGIISIGGEQIRPVVVK